jgi:hypothetical protein
MLSCACARKTSFEVKKLQEERMCEVNASTYLIIVFVSVNRISNSPDISNYPYL